MLEQMMKATRTKILEEMEVENRRGAVSFALF
jgi:hypothetical protein